MFPYINYNELDEFYTLKGVGNLLRMDKETLKRSYRRYDINPQRNEIGDWGLSRYDLRRSHNFLYKEGKAGTNGKTDDPWARQNC